MFFYGSCFFIVITTRFPTQGSFQRKFVMCTRARSRVAQCSQGLPKPAAKPLAVKKEIQKVKSEAIRPPRLHRQGSPAIQPNPSSGSSLPPISHYDSHVASNIPVPDPEEKGPFTAAANEAVAAAAAAAAAAPMTPQSALRSAQVPASFEELIMTAASAASSAAAEAVIQSLSKAYGIQFPPQDDYGGG